MIQQGSIYLAVSILRHIGVTGLLTEDTDCSVIGDLGSWQVV